MKIEKTVGAIALLLAIVVVFVNLFMFAVNTHLAKIDDRLEALEARP